MHENDFNSRRKAFFEQPASLGRFLCNLHRLGRGILAVTVTLHNYADGEETEQIEVMSI